MTLYYRITDPADVRDLSDQVAAWKAAGNPKADHWAEQPPAPSPDAVWTDGAWVTPEPPPPQPDWPTFKATALGSATLNQILAAAYQSAPVAAGALTPALLRAEQGDAADFSTAWTAICAAVPVPEEVIAGFTAVATSCNLPVGFVQSLTPVRHRARNEDGTFRADDPATPVDEAWA